MWQGYLWMITFGMFFLLLFFIMQWLTHGFVLKFMRVKGSREKNIMVKMRSKLGDYLIIGRLHEREVIFKKRGSKQKSTLNIPLKEDGSLESVFYRFLGIVWCDVDEEKNAFSTLDFKGVQGFDDERQEGLIQRALYKPSPHGRNEIILIVLLVIVIVVAIVGCVMSYQTYKAVHALQLLQEVAPGVTPGV